MASTARIRFLSRRSGGLGAQTPDAGWYQWFWRSDRRSTLPWGGARGGQDRAGEWSCRARRPGRRPSAVELERGRLAGPARRRWSTIRGASGGRAVALSGRGAVRRRVTSRLRDSRRGAPGCGPGRAPAARGWPCSWTAVGAGSGAVRARGAIAACACRSAPAAGDARVSRCAWPTRSGVARAPRTLVLDSLRAREARSARAAPKRGAQLRAAPRAGPAAATAAPAPAGGYRNPVFATPTRAGQARPDGARRGRRPLRLPRVHHRRPLPGAALERPRELGARGAGTAGPARWADQTGEWNPWAPSVIERPGLPRGGRHRAASCSSTWPSTGRSHPPPTASAWRYPPSPEGPYQQLGPLAFRRRRGRRERPAARLRRRRRLQQHRPGAVRGLRRRWHGLPVPVHRSQVPRRRRRRRQLPVRPHHLGDRAGTPTCSAPPGPARRSSTAPTPGWEVAPFGTVVENPWPVRTAGGYMLLYSGGAYNGPYGMGYATSSSPTGAVREVRREPGPARGARACSAPGGGMLVTGAEGSGPGWPTTGARAPTPTRASCASTRCAFRAVGVIVASTGPPARPSPPRPRTGVPGPAPTAASSSSSSSSGSGKSRSAPQRAAHLVVDRHHVAALRAGPQRRGSLVAAHQRRDRAEERQAEADQEPEEERAALDLRRSPRPTGRRRRG